jgi:protein SSD1
VESNIFGSSAVRELVEELSCKANFLVARKLVAALPDKAFLRRQQSPNPRRLHSFVDRMNRLGFGFDESSSGSLQSSLCKVKDDDLRKVSHLTQDRPLVIRLYLIDDREWKQSS